MNEYRVTKYNPEKRNELGHYLDKEEWTEFFQVGDKVSLEEYEKVEAEYIVSAKELLSRSGVKNLEVVGLEGHQKVSKLTEGAIIQINDLTPILRSLFRGDFWCRLESELGFIHIGWDFYMYIGVMEVNHSIIANVEKRGLYVEKFISPYHPENC